MDQNRFTEKSLEALRAAQRLAAKLHHQQMDVEHLLLALLDQERGLAPSILNKAEVRRRCPQDRRCSANWRSCRASPAAAGEIGITSRLNRLLGKAEDEAKKLKDEYVSVEHLLLAMLDDTGAGRQDPQGIRRQPRPLHAALQAGARPPARHLAESRGDLRSRSKNMAAT